MKEKPALLIIDMLNTLDFPEGRQILPPALKAAKVISRLKSKFKAKGLPVIYVNDNFGEWQSDWKKVFARCSRADSLGRPLALSLAPESDDYFVLKPKHSGFYLSPLEILLKDLKVKRLVITGIAGNLCVLFTAHDAHMRDFKVEVPRDCLASNSPADTKMALRQLKNALKIPTPLAKNLKI